MEAIIFIVFIIMLYYVMVMISKSTLRLIKSDQSVQSFDIDKIWDRLGEQPMYGDQADQGAVDVAIHIQDLIWHLEDEQPEDRKQQLEQQLQQAYHYLFEVTLVAAGPAPDYSLYEEDEVSVSSNVINFEDHRSSKL